MLCMYCYKNVHIILEKLIRPKTKQGHIHTKLDRKDSHASTVYISGLLSDLLNWFKLVDGTFEQSNVH